MTGLPILVLTTKGRRSGRRRPTPLAYVQDGPGWIVVAGNRGASRDPLWLENLRADPIADVEVDRRRHRVCATIVDGDARAALWSRVRADMTPLAEYERRTTRRFPIVRLAPMAENGAAID